MVVSARACHPFADHVAVLGPDAEWDCRGVSASDAPGRRRAVIAAMAGVGVTAACGTVAGPAGPSAAPAEPPATPDGAPRVGAGLQPVPATRAPRPVATVDEIPVGGGQVFPERQVVITQPTAGEFHGFGIICTHDGCELNAVANGTINCPCHGSRYAITDGSVVQGPARTGLRVEQIAVDDGRIVLL